MKSSFYVVIEGTIGVGKTSLAKILSEKLNARLILEEFEQNPFLEDFYNDPKSYAFQTQLFFLLSRYKQQMEIQQMDLFSRNSISDYMFAKDRLFATLNLSEKELGLYNTVANLLEKKQVLLFIFCDFRISSFEKILDKNFLLDIDFLILKFSIISTPIPKVFILFNNPNKFFNSTFKTIKN